MKLNRLGRAVSDRGAIDGVVPPVLRGIGKVFPCCWLDDDTLIYQLEDAAGARLETLYVRPGSAADRVLVSTEGANVLKAGGGVWAAMLGSRGDVRVMTTDGLKTYAGARLCDVDADGSYTLSPDHQAGRDLDICGPDGAPLALFDTADLLDNATAGPNVRKRGDVLTWIDTDGVHCYTFAPGLWIETAYLARTEPVNLCVPVVIHGAIWILERTERLTLRPIDSPLGHVVSDGPTFAPDVRVDSAGDVWIAWSVGAGELDGELQSGRWLIDNSTQHQRVDLNAAPPAPPVTIPQFADSPITLSELGGQAYDDTHEFIDAGRMPSGLIDQFIQSAKNTGRTVDVYSDDSGVWPASHEAVYQRAKQAGVKHVRRCVSAYPVKRNGGVVESTGETNDRLELLIMSRRDVVPVLAFYCQNNLQEDNWPLPHVLELLDFQWMAMYLQGTRECLAFGLDRRTSLPHPELREAFARMQKAAKGAPPIIEPIEPPPNPPIEPPKRPPIFPVEPKEPDPMANKLSPLRRACIAASIQGALYPQLVDYLNPLNHKADPSWTRDYPDEGARVRAWIEWAMGALDTVRPVETNTDTHYGVMVRVLLTGQAADFPDVVTKFLPVPAVPF